MVADLQNPPIAESKIEIRHRTGGEVLTAIEFLSPANKGGGAGQEKHLEKQAEDAARVSALSSSQ